MEIETKYDLGDIVYIAHKSAIFKCEVEQIDICTFRKALGRNEIISYTVLTDSRHQFNRDEDEVYATFEAVREVLDDTKNTTSRDQWARDAENWSTQPPEVYATMSGGVHIQIWHPGHHLSWTRIVPKGEVSDWATWGEDAIDLLSKMKSGELKTEQP